MSRYQKLQIRSPILDYYLNFDFLYNLVDCLIREFCDSGLVIYVMAHISYCIFICLGLTNSSNGKHIANNPDLGCDFRKQSWCLHQPKIYLPQYVVSLCVITVGYASSVLLCYTIFSKILGPQPQVWNTADCDIYWICSPGKFHLKCDIP